MSSIVSISESSNVTLYDNTRFFYYKEPSFKLQAEVPFFFCQFQPQSSLLVPYFLGLEILLSKKVPTYSIT